MHSSILPLERCLAREGDGRLNESISGSLLNPQARGSRLARWLAVVLAITAATGQASVHLWAPSGMPTGKTVTAEALWEVFDQALPPEV
ncbi:MAG TPA: hypothetical protein VLT83_07940, partial [Opitutaceae bacterium]|nr:hypothetical protein [Opitutaceae bacterium]